MPDNPQNQSNAVSISSSGPVDNIEEGMQNMKIESKEACKEEEREERGQLNKYPDRPGEPDCSYYMKTGQCSYGNNCRYNHPPLAAKTAKNTSELPQREGQPECGYFLKTGACRYGATCKYHHPLDKHGVGPVQLNTLGLPMRQEEKPCPYYMRNHTCKFGATCKFNHPELPSTLPISGSAIAGTMGSSLPSNVISYPGVFPAWSVTGLPYMPSSRAPFPLSYVPFGFPAFQGSVATHNWNDYVGNMNAVSASSMMDTNLVYTSKNQGDLVTNGQVDMFSMPSVDLPERPGQPECRYFMSTGTCRYGINCKFHHPKERSAQLATNTLGPHGLPLRPGKDICAYFRLYGICKYGPTCKFNHPIVGFYVGMSPMPTENHGSVPSQRNSVVANSSEIPHSKSSKITNWIQKPEIINDKNHSNSEVRAAEGSHEPVDHKLNSAPSTSELAQDQAD